LPPPHEAKKKNYFDKLKTSRFAHAQTCALGHGRRVI